MAKLRTRLVWILAAGMAWGTPAALRGFVSQTTPDERVILVTLDGARAEEVFGGLDLDVLKRTMRNGERAEDASTGRHCIRTPPRRSSRLLGTVLSEVSRHARNMK